MVITFTKKLHTEDGGIREFFFNRIYTAGGIQFHVSVLNSMGELLHFNMVEKYRKWHIDKAPQPPDWVMKLEEDLNRAICQGMLS